MRSSLVKLLSFSEWVSLAYFLPAPQLIRWHRFLTSSTPHVLRRASSPQPGMQRRIPLPSSHTPQARLWAPRAVGVVHLIREQACGSPKGLEFRHPPWITFLFFPQTSSESRLWVRPVLGPRVSQMNKSWFRPLGCCLPIQGEKCWWE